jgi:hypothetical protein
MVYGVAAAISPLQTDRLPARQRVSNAPEIPSDAIPYRARTRNACYGHVPEPATWSRWFQGDGKYLVVVYRSFVYSKSAKDKKALAGPESFGRSARQEQRANIVAT